MGQTSNESINDMNVYKAQKGKNVYGPARFANQGHFSVDPAQHEEINLILDNNDDYSPKNKPLRLHRQKSYYELDD